MNKTVMVFVLASILLLGLGFVSAQQMGDGNENQSSEHGLGLLIRLQAGDIHMTQSGETVQIQAGEGDRLRLRVGDAEAHSELEITSDGQKLMARLSNGRDAEIKVMPSVASETALERLRIRNCTEENNCTIELKEFGQEDQARLAYEVQTERQSRIFGLFSARMQVRAQVDAENGELIGVGKPWWAFLATEPEE